MLGNRFLDSVGIAPLSLFEVSLVVLMNTASFPAFDMSSHGIDNTSMFNQSTGCSRVHACSVNAENLYQPASLCACVLLFVGGVCTASDHYRRTDSKCKESCTQILIIEDQASGL